jgi:GNAT superfamily N-acetyltransferase
MGGEKIEPASVQLVLEDEPAPETVRFLDEELYGFNVEATGITDGRLLTVLLRGAAGEMLGGAHGWSWGGTCYVRHFFLDARLRKQGHGTAMMRAVEREAVARGCTQIVLETHDFQAPDFYRKLGFAVAGAVEGYPRGHRYLTMLKRLP